MGHRWGADILVTKEKEEFCLEINDSSIGFNANHIVEDMAGIVECAMARLMTEYKDNI